MKEFVSHSLGETATIAGEWLASVSGALPTEALQRTVVLVVGLSGNLGSGKTAFTKAVAKHLGIKEDVTSPTFVIMKTYPTTDPYWKNLIHIDAYRLESGKEFDILNFNKLATTPGNLILIEWPENVKEAIKNLDNYRQISFEAGMNDNERIIRIS